MMLRNLIDEMKRRRLLPVAILALAVLIIAPLVFLKGAPEDAPSADAAAPAAATPAKLPARAARLLAATDAAASAGSAKGAAHDPFNPPAAFRAAADKTSTSSGSTAAKTDTSKKSASTGSTVTTTPAVVTPPKSGSAKSNSSKSSSGARTIAVDVRFGPHKDTKIRRSIPRYQAFYIHGKLVAVFVKYSPSKKKAVFAVAPGLHISGPVNCRVQDGVCKYLDIKAGSYAWLTMVTANKTVVSRRLDVVHAKSRTSSATTKATAASARNEQACLLGKLLAMKAGDSLVDRDACES